MTDAAARLRQQHTHEAGDCHDGKAHDVWRLMAAGDVHGARVRPPDSPGRDRVVSEGSAHWSHRSPADRPASTVAASDTMNEQALERWDNEGGDIPPQKPDRAQ